MRIAQALTPRPLVALGLASVVLALSLASSTSSTTLAAINNCNTNRPAGGSDSEEQSMLTLINNYRAKNGAGPLVRTSSLDRSALWKSTDMATNHYFAHDDLIRGWQERLIDCGYTMSYDGEDLAEGHADAAATLDQWRTSPPHNANLLNASYHAIGIGRAASSGGDWYWTADFGQAADAAPASSVPPAPPAPPSPPGPPAPPTTSASTAPSAPPAPPNVPFSNSLSTSTAPSSATTSGAGNPSGAGSPWLLPSLPSSSSTSGSIGIGATALVNTPGDCLRAHSAPSVSASVATCVPDGSPLFLVQGPISADGHTWWAAFGAGWVVADYLRVPS